MVTYSTLLAVCVSSQHNACHKDTPSKTTPGAGSFRAGILRLAKELEIWLGEDDNMVRFMLEGRYNTWQSQETSPQRLQALDQHDPDRPQQGVNNRDDLLVNLMAKCRRQLKTFLSQVAKYTIRNMYATIVCHAISLNWIYERIRQDYNIQQIGIHFLNITDLKYDAQTKTPASFYN